MKKRKYLIRAKVASDLQTSSGIFFRDLEAFFLIPKRKKPKKTSYKNGEKEYVRAVYDLVIGGLVVDV